MSNVHGVLYVVATPIGNLRDISERALEILREVDGILAEDTRHSARLLTSHDIDKRLTSLHAHNEQSRAQKVIERLLSGESLALISDAGTPSISDPGNYLVKAVLAQGIKVVPLPGACALVCALSASGIPAGRFVFEGFLPPGAGLRRTRLRALSSEPRTVVFYEAPHRIKVLLQDLVEIFGAERGVTVARELTKTFETITTGTLLRLAQVVGEDEYQQKGEMVVVVAGASQVVEDEDELERVLQTLLEELSVKQAVSIAVKLTSQKRNKVYRLARSLHADDGA